MVAITYTTATGIFNYTMYEVGRYKKKDNFEQLGTESSLSWINDGLGMNTAAETEAFGLAWTGHKGRLSCIFPFP